MRLDHLLSKEHTLRAITVRVVGNVVFTSGIVDESSSCPGVLRLVLLIWLRLVGVETAWCSWGVGFGTLLGPETSGPVAR